MADMSVAEYDQLLAEARTKLDLLRQTVDNLTAKRGETRAVTSVVQMLMRWDHSEVVSALAAALIEPRRTDQ